MKIDNAKDLAKLIALCRKTGVQSIRVDNVEFHLGEAPMSAQPKTSKTSITLPKAGITAPSTGPDTVESDEMTDEQLLMWSVSDSPDANAADQN